MPRFGIRSLFFTTAACATFLGFGSRIGYATSVGVVMSALVVLWSVRSKRRHWWWMLRAGLGLSGAVACWFLAVDAVWRMNCCAVCRTQHYIVDYRVLGLPAAREETEVISWLALVAQDLGAPCQHEWRPETSLRGGVESHLRDRGILQRIVSHRIQQVCGEPWWNWYLCDDGLDRFAGLAIEPYRDEVATRIQTLAAEQPQTANQFWKRAGVDEGYLWGGFLIDQFALGNRDAGCLFRAEGWLQEHQDSEDRSIGYAPSEAIPRIRELERLGSGEVWVYRVERGKSYPSGRAWAFGRLAVELPEDPAERRRAFSVLSCELECEDDQGAPAALTDYGQQFIEVY